MIRGSSKWDKRCLSLTRGTCCRRLSMSCFTQLSTARYTSSSDGTFRLSLEIRSSTFTTQTNTNTHTNTSFSPDVFFFFFFYPYTFTSALVCLFPVLHVYTQTTALQVSALQVQIEMFIYATVGKIQGQAKEAQNLHTKPDAIFDWHPACRT